MSWQVTFFQIPYKCQIIHSKQNEEQMKKVLFVLAIAAFAACNNAAETATEAAEATVDSAAAAVEATVDSAKASIDSTAAAAVDSAKAAVDSLKK